jgi:hypothetical protein
MKEIEEIEACIEEIEACTEEIEEKNLCIEIFTYPFVL